MRHPGPPRCYLTGDREGSPSPLKRVDPDGIPARGLLRGGRGLLLLDPLLRPLQGGDDAVDALLGKELVDLVLVGVDERDYAGDDVERAPAALLLLHDVILPVGGCGADDLDLHQRALSLL